MNHWKDDPEIARQQLELVTRQLAEKPWPTHFRVYADAVLNAGGNSWPPSVIEIGAGVGHGFEILKRGGRGVLFHPWFTGIDISEHAIALARERYQNAQWHATDASTLPTFERRDIVVDGSCVLHVDAWQAHLGYLCGASRDAVILHRIPITPNLGHTRRWTTSGYGHEFPSWEFNLSDVTGEMLKHGFEHTETRKADGDSLTLTFRKVAR